ncbi:MAG TPA: hypothetical protein PKD55_26165, partial [Bellilinea sp.]|nr:hypothetical protein [Bellilinea sp.]
MKDSREGHLKEAEISRSVYSEESAFEDIRQGFVYERVPHITLGDIANNIEIDVIWENFQEELELIRERLNLLLTEMWEEWEIPRNIDDKWPQEAKDLHDRWWELRVARQKEIDASIAA